MCVQDIDAQCVLQFTLIHAAGCALHRLASRVIHRLELYSCFTFAPDRRSETSISFGYLTSTVSKGTSVFMRRGRHSFRYLLCSCFSIAPDRRSETGLSFGYLTDDSQFPVFTPRAGRPHRTPPATSGFFPQRVQFLSTRSDGRVLSFPSVIILPTQHRRHPCLSVAADIHLDTFCVRVSVLRPNAVAKRPLVWIPDSV